MRRFDVSLECLRRVMALAAGARVQAGFVYGDYYFELEQLGQRRRMTIRARVRRGYLPTGPTATTDGGDLDQDGKHLRVGLPTRISMPRSTSKSLFTGCPRLRYYRHLRCLSTGVAWRTTSTIGSGGDGYAGYFMGIRRRNRVWRKRPTHDTSSPYRTGVQRQRQSVLRAD